MLNKIIRIMNFKRLRDRVQMCTLYKSMNILLINDVYELETAKFMRSFYHRMLPENLNQVMHNILITLDPSLQMVIIWKEFLQRVSSCHASMLA